MTSTGISLTATPARRHASGHSATSFGSRRILSSAGTGHGPISADYGDMANIRTGDRLTQRLADIQLTLSVFRAHRAGREIGQKVADAVAYCLFEICHLSAVRRRAVSHRHRGLQAAGAAGRISGLGWGGDPRPRQSRAHPPSCGGGPVSGRRRAVYGVSSFRRSRSGSFAKLTAYQALSVVKHLSVGRPPCCRCLLGGLPAPCAGPRRP
jgi:hypothetical protein